MSITPRSFDFAIVKLIIRNKSFAYASGGGYQHKARPCFVTKADQNGFWAAPLCGAGQLSDGIYGPKKNMKVGCWAPVNFLGTGVPVPAHPLANIDPFVLPLLRNPEHETMRIKSCFIWVQTAGEYVLYREFHEWETQMAREDKPVRLDEFFDLDMGRIVQLRMQHASYGGK